MSNATTASHKHQDKRINIPTQELRDFAATDEDRPSSMLYPRDPSLDPQLVWSGKDEQDRAALEVPTVPIYIQETIQPQAIIEAFRNDTRHDGEQEAPSLFESQGLPFEEKVDFYHHEEDWKNRMILGDSLLVMNSLAEKEGLRGKVQMIYLDPPYGIKFGSNWQVSTRKKDVKDGKLDDATRQPEQIKAFRDTWAKGVHSYLSYLRDRLALSHELLSQSGSIFVQISSENLHLVRCILDETFGASNFVSLISFVTTSGFDAGELSRAGDYLLWYAKDRENVRVRDLWATAMDRPGYGWLVSPDGHQRGMTAAEKSGEARVPPEATCYAPDNIQSQGAASSPQPFKFHKRKYLPGANAHWKANWPVGMERLARAGRIHVASNSLRYVRKESDFPLKGYNNLWTDTGTGNFTEDKVYVVQTSTKVIERCMLLTTDPGDLVLDPTCGGGTTACVAEQWGRRWITCDTSRVALALARTRLMTARFPYYLLSDSPEGQDQEFELTGVRPAIGAGRNLRKGFVYRRVPRITLGDIANNPRIDEVHDDYQARMEPLQTDINKALGQSWEEWEIPFEPGAKWSTAVVEAHKMWWALRKARQKAMDEAIAQAGIQNAVFLFDQPYEDKKRVRVSGTFTVESLSPHRILAPEEERPQAERRAQAEASGTFHAMLLENLRKAGIQNTLEKERIHFESLEPHSGVWIHALGTYQDAKGQLRKIALSFGPEHGTVGPEQAKEAAKEALAGPLKLEDSPRLYLCGFAFDPYLTEDAKSYGKLKVLPTKLSPELLLGQELKATGAGNLFMVFGEPDLKRHTLPDGRMQVEIKGLDIYDPMTGEVKDNTTDEIACWFLDTDYNGELFVVRHAYFTGADEPYDKLKRALKSEIREDAWEALYTTTSRPFPPSSTGKIAVKVINHYGDEVLKVYDLKA